MPTTDPGGQALLPVLPAEADIQRFTAFEMTIPLATISSKH